MIEIDEEKYSLKSLLDIKHPFLEKLRNIAPGTFKHCQNVSDLCESIALEFPDELDTDTMGVLGLYHDAGKIAFPEAFFENQKDKKNIHDDLDPQISFHLISKHISDTALILIQLEDFPNEFINPIIQHHGDSAIRSLFKASEDVDDFNFRYKNTIPPQTLEAIILMICDSVEATSRSIEYSRKEVESVRGIVDETLHRLEDDGQLDMLMVGSLKKIRKSLYRELESRFHKRGEYGDEDKMTLAEKRKKKDEKES